MSKENKTQSTQCRPSASLIIAAKTATSENVNCDYQILIAKRTTSTAYAPGHCVFPGGVFESGADDSHAWLEYFYETGFTRQQLLQLQVQGPHRPQPLFYSSSNLPRDITLRITAIRETFEEVGILICCSPTTSRDSGAAHFHENFDRVHWQHLIHNDATKFLTLCRELKVVPDLWSLYEWSVWRSPHSAQKRYDTVFYFAALERQPGLLLERSEMEAAFWHTPAEALHCFATRQIWLAPVQYYELSRLTHAINWLQLLQFARQRSNKGSTLLMPSYYRCDDGLVGALAGDDFFAAETLETIDVPQTTQAFAQRAMRLHRLVIRDMHDLSVELNIAPIDEHYSPVVALDTQHSKL